MCGEVDLGTAFAAVPDSISSGPTVWITSGRLDRGDLGALVGQHHGGHRTGHAGRKIDDAQPVKKTHTGVCLIQCFAFAVCAPQPMSEAVEPGGVPRADELTLVRWDVRELPADHVL